MFLELFLISTMLVTDSTSTEVSVSGNYGQSTHAIEGDWHGGFSVQAASVYDIDSVHRVFGEASYSWNQSHGNRYVENADYELLSPYLTVDTVGGGLRSETYFFRGGYRMKKNRIVWHAALQFRALQSYRAIDPRPKNKVADLQVDAGIGYQWNGYGILVMGQIGRYKQNNEIKFYSELGESQIYHLVGPGTAYTRFSGSKKESYYHGWNAGVSAAMLPYRQGWIAQVDYRYMRVDKELHDNTYIPIGRIRTHAVDATLGYVTPAWRVMAQGGVNLRRGQQFIYGEAANNTYTLLALQPNYAENLWHVGAKGSYRLNLPIGYLRFAGTINYQLSTIHCQLFVENRWAELNDLLTDHRLQATVAIRYAFPIKGRYAWFFEPAAHYDRYTKTTRHSWQVALQTGIVF